MSKAIGDRLSIINVSGPPASGKTTLCRTLVSVFERYGIKCLVESLTGFHYLSFMYAITLIILIYLGYAKYIYKERVRRRRLNPYDVIPKHILKRHLDSIIYTFEFISLFLKFLIIKLKIFLMRPRIVLLDEGVVNTSFYYILFFHSRESALWKKLLQKLWILLHKLCSKTRCLIVLLLPELNEEIRLWVKRDDIPKLERAKIYIYSYRKLYPSILRILTHGNVDIEIYSFNNVYEALEFISRLIQLHGEDYE